MHGKKKLISVFFTIALLAAVIFTAGAIPVVSEEIQETAFLAGDNLYFWYTDDSLTDYLTNVSASYYEEKGVHVIPVL